MPILHQPPHIRTLFMVAKGFVRIPWAQAGFCKVISSSFFNFCEVYSLFSTLFTLVDQVTTCRCATDVPLMLQQTTTSQLVEEPSP